MVSASPQSVISSTRTTIFMWFLGTERSRCNPIKIVLKTPRFLTLPTPFTTDTLSTMSRIVIALLKKHFENLMREFVRIVGVKFRAPAQKLTK
jgi:hypothetical protein